MKKSSVALEADILSVLNSSKPLEVLKDWLDQAKKESGLKEPWAMSLATSLKAIPSVRTVLLKKLDGEKLLFFSNYLSQKGEELERNPQAAVGFHWDSLGKQIRIQGLIKKTSRRESVDYWNQRNRNSQLSQWISRQSQPVSDRKSLENLKVLAEQKFHKIAIPCPKHWGGYLLCMKTIEFWQHRPYRLHDRFLFKKTGSRWICQRLFP